MNKFLGECDVRLIKGSERDVMVLRPFSFLFEGILITVPRGAMSDGASLQNKLVWLIIGSPWIGFYRRAVVLHDWLCKVKGVLLESFYDSFALAWEDFPPELDDDVRLTQMESGGVKVQKRLTYQQVHRAFYEAMKYDIQFFPEKMRKKANKKADLMFWAVRKFGPRW